MSSEEKPDMPFEDFKREALKYSAEERAELRDILAASLEEEEEDSVLSADARRRYEAYLTKPLSDEELLAKLSSIHAREGEKDPEYDRRWREEIDRRYREYKEGKAQVYDVDEVLAELRAKLA